MIASVGIHPLLHVAAIGFVAIIFARSLLEKTTQYSLYVATLRDYRVIAAPLAPFAAAALLMFELATLVMLLVPDGNAFAAIPAICLFTLYGLAMALALRAGRTEIECGCGGQGQIVSWLLVTRNLILVLIAGVALLPTTGHSLSWLEVGIAICTIAIGWLLLATAEKSIETAAAIRRLKSESFL